MAIWHRAPYLDILELQTENVKSEKATTFLDDSIVL